MIPRTASDLADLLAEIERQHHEASDLLEEATAEGARWRPDETRWSAAGHLAHLCIVNEAYLRAMTEAVESARAGGAAMSDGPYRHPWLATRFVRLMEPPPKRRTKTLRAMVPEADVDAAETLRAFQALQADLRQLVEEVRGLDLGKIRFGSPFFRLLRFSLGSGLEAVLAHNRRHLWIIRELIDRPDFPGRRAA